MVYIFANDARSYLGGLVRRNEGLGISFMAKRFSSLVALLLVLASTFALLPPAPATAAGQVVLVVIAKNSDLDDVSMAELRRAYLGLPTTVDGRRLLPLNLPVGTAERTSFDRRVMGLEPDRVGAFWVDRRIRDQSMPPRAVTSATLAAKVVASLPGALTYVFANELNPQIKALRIDGKAPGEPGYPLR